jgi:hypothetical protein
MMNHAPYSTRQQLSDQAFNYGRSQSLKLTEIKPLPRHFGSGSVRAVMPECYNVVASIFNDEFGINPFYAAPQPHLVPRSDDDAKKTVCTPEKSWIVRAFDACKSHREFAPVMTRAFINMSKKIDYLDAVRAVESANERLTKMEFRYTSTDEELCEFAKAKSAHVMRKVSAIDDTQAAFDVARNILADYGLAFRDELIEQKEKDNELQSLINRATNELWWRRALRQRSALEIERVARDLTIVHKHGQSYCSNFSLQRRRVRDQDNLSMMQNTIAYDADDQSNWFTLNELAGKSISNPEIRRAEMFVRLKGFESIAQANDHVGMFYTPTYLRPVLNSISSLKSFNASEFNSAAASRRDLSTSLDSTSALTSGLGGNIDALKVSNKNALSDVKNATDSLGEKADEQTAYQKIIADKMAELNDSFGVGIPELDKKSERNNQLLDDIKTMTEKNNTDLTDANKAQLDKAFAQFDETKKQTDLLANIKELTAELGDNSVTDNELKSVNNKLAQMNNQLDSSNNKLDAINDTLVVNESQSSKRTDQLLNALANSDAQGESRWRELRDQYKQGNDDLIDSAVEVIGSGADALEVNAGTLDFVGAYYDDLVGITGDCNGLSFGPLNISCAQVNRFKEYFGFILYFLTAYTLFDILFTGIVPDPKRAGI